MNAATGGAPLPVLRGIWPPIPIHDQPDGRLDHAVIETVTRRLAAGGVHGIYTGDTASEFYALEAPEWDELAVLVIELARDLGIPAGIGCTWTNGAGALRRIERARELGYHDIHLSQPYWSRLNGPSQAAFWRAVGEVAGPLGVIVYGGSQGQLPIDGGMVARLREWCPAIVGTKTTGFDAVAMTSLLTLHPDLAHFVHEQVLVGWSGAGAVGAFSNLALLDPAFTVAWYRLIKAGRWDAAFAVQRRVLAFYEHGVVPARQAGYTVDKALAELGGHPGLTRLMRPPYAAPPDELVARMRDAAQELLAGGIPADGT